ncbi:MAG: enoyl-CoA hydratase/isomerase family protein, partial [Vicinamibacteria bacterium]|nr:enoyl-CoA hydratase/isomerase family protein [Vicinamibacteria bacterium]
MTVNLEMRGGVAVLTLDHPPVNAVNAAVKRALLDHLDAVLGDDAVSAVVIAGAGKHFSAGADIREFSSQPPSGPGFTELIDRIERAARPVVAAIQGTAAGGGLEIAMSCHARVAEEGAEFSLPEVSLGIVPGAGGTVRLPRLVGVEAALDMILSGRRVGAEEAARIGLVDEVVPRHAGRDRAVAYAARLARTPFRRTRDLAPPALSPEQRGRFEADLRKPGRSSRAARAAFECVAESLTLPFDEAIRRERAVFSELVASPESRALRHVFFAEREAQKAGELKKGTTMRAIRSVGVIGFGTMGSGISMAFANAGIPATAIDETPEAVDRGLARVRSTCEEALGKGRISAEECASRIALVRGSTDYRDLEAVDLVIEAVFEEMDLKHKVFAKLDEVCSDKAILA